MKMPLDFFVEAESLKAYLNSEITFSTLLHESIAVCEIAPLLNLTLTLIGPEWEPFSLTEVDALAVLILTQLAGDLEQQLWQKKDVLVEPYDCIFQSEVLLQFEGHSECLEVCFRYAAVNAVRRPPVQRLCLHAASSCDMTSTSLSTALFSPMPPSRAPLSPMPPPFRSADLLHELTDDDAVISCLIIELPPCVLILTRSRLLAYSALDMSRNDEVSLTLLSEDVPAALLKNGTGGAMRALAMARMETLSDIVLFCSTALLFVHVDPSGCLWGMGACALPPQLMALSTAPLAHGTVECAGMLCFASAHVQYAPATSWQTPLAPPPIVARWRLSQPPHPATGGTMSGTASSGVGNAPWPFAATLLGEQAAGHLVREGDTLEATSLATHDAKSPAKATAYIALRDGLTFLRLGGGGAAGDILGIHRFLVQGGEGAEKKAGTVYWEPTEGVFFAARTSMTFARGLPMVRLGEFVGMPFADNLSRVLTAASMWGEFL
jgi:hypothetical protein